MTEARRHSCRLGKRVGCDPSYVSQVFTTWVTFLAEELRQPLKWRTPIVWQSDSKTFRTHNHNRLYWTADWAVFISASQKGNIFQLQKQGHFKMACGSEQECHCELCFAGLWWPSQWQTHQSWQWSVLFAVRRFQCRGRPGVSCGRGVKGTGRRADLAWFQRQGSVPDDTWWLQPVKICCTSAHPCWGDNPKIRTYHIFTQQQNS